MNGVTGAEFEPLHPEYAGSNNGHSTNGCRYKVIYYNGYNEQQEVITASRSLADHLAATHGGSFTVIGASNAI